MTEIMPDNLLLGKVTRLQEELVELNKLFELTRIVSYASDINSLGDKFVEFLKLQFNCSNIAFFVNNYSKYHMVAYNNIESPFSIEFENHEEGIWQTIELGKPFSIIDVNGKNIYHQFFEKNQIESINSSIWIPFIADSKVIAILSLGCKQDNSNFSESEIRFLEKISEHISPVINKYFVLQSREANVSQLQTTLHNISILYNIGQAMNFIDDLKKLLKIILGKAIQTTGAQKGSLMLYDRLSSELVIKVVFGIPDKEIEDKINEGLIECTRIKIGEGIAGEAFASKKAVITNLGANDPRFKQSDQSRVTSILCMPLIVKEEAIGVINITNKLDGKFFNQDDLDFMGALANQAAIAINNAQLYELAITDGLTKLYIYRHFQCLLDNELKRSNRYQHTFSLLMMDIDNFKTINDSYGHQLGDEVLKQIAIVIQHTCRKIDMPSRYGGEEFAIILPETNKDNARKIAERLRQNIEKIVVRTKDNEPVSPTISIGISSFPEDASTQEELIEFADKSMYFAKASGKNCVAEFINGTCGLVYCDISNKADE